MRAHADAYETAEHMHHVAGQMAQARGETYAAGYDASVAAKAASEDPEVARIQRNMDLLAGLTDDPFAEEA